MMGIAKVKDIVVVDDESMVTSSLKMLLSLEKDLNPILFNDPKEAIEYLKGNPADLILSDFLMPEINGIEFLSEAKKIKPGITTILLTGYADKENAIKAINEVGIYRYLEKPWNNDDLIHTIKQGLERSYLVESLNAKVKELSIAQKELEMANRSLESKVIERTKQLDCAYKEINAIVQSCADVILEVDKKGNILSSNKAMEDLTSLQSSDIKGKNLSSFLISDDVFDFEKIKKDDGVSFLREISIFNKEALKLIPVEISLAPVEQNQSYVAVIRDVSVQKEMERLRDDFIATLTHDLRTPLLAAIQTLKFFLDGSLGELNEKQKTFLDTMLSSNKDMLGLVNALLEVYKYESGQLNLVKEKFVLNELLDSCIQTVVPLAENKNIELEKQFEENLVVLADKQELRRVIGNFLGNALNYTQKEGKVILKASQNDGKIIVCVEDNGPGIPEGDVEKLFKRFSQGTSQKRSTSTGLGLYLSRQIVEAHNGQVWLESELGEGSKFYFSLSCIKNEAVV